MSDRILRGLLIEDDADDTLLLVHLMSEGDRPSFKFVFACAEDLATGLRLLSEERFEVILLDLMLPDSQGMETVLKVRAQAPDIPIVVLTGLRDETLGLEALTHGAQDYQIKGSVTGSELKRTISHAVERHRLLTSLRNVIEGTPDGMAIVDSRGEIRYVNAAAQALLGPKGEPLVGRPFPHPIPASRRGELTLAEGSSQARTVELRVSEIDWKDQPVRLLALRDITELRQVERLKAEVVESRRMDALKDALMNNVSHEIRTPLTVIKAAAIQLQEDLAVVASEEQANMLRLQYGSILRLEKIVTNVLDLSRLESGKAEIDLQKVDAVALLRDVAAGFGLVAKGRAIRVEQEVPPKLPHVCADPELFARLLGNLIDNALRFARGRVLLRARAEGAGHVRFSVEDDGPGIPRHRIGELFSKFVQLQRSDRGSYHGTGLGLAICKEIVERQAGKIWVESTEGQGSQFHFLLPQYDPATARSRGVIASA